MLAQNHRGHQSHGFATFNGGLEVCSELGLIPPVTEAGIRNRVREKRLAVVDDSIVRGDTTRNVVKRFRTAGAEEVHLFITFPRITGPCFYGIDMSTYSELIGAGMEPEEIVDEVEADSVNYQPIGDYVNATGIRRNQLCFGCVTGEYPTPMANKMAVRIREQLTMGGEESGRIYEVS